jgi:hypothetical protein
MNVAEAAPADRLIDCSAFFDREARWLSFLAGPVERALSIHRLNGCYTDFLSRIARRETDPTQVFDPALSQFVAPKKPFRVRRVVGIRRHLLDASFQDLEDVSLLVSAVENDGKGIPVLLRQYLKLSGRRHEPAHWPPSPVLDLSG